jgi:peroxiredoxin
MIAVKWGWMPDMPTELKVSDLKQVFEEARDMDGSMNERLALFADAVRKQHPASAAIVDRLVARLCDSGAGAAAPKPGDMMPLFVLPDENGHLVGLEGLLKQGPVVVTFHRGHWCPYCRIAINTLARAQARIEALGARIVAIVPDRERYAGEMKSDSGAKFPILTDMDNGYAMSLNLAIWVGTEMEAYMTSIGRKLPEYQGNDSWVLPIPAIFVVAADGRTKARFIDTDYRKRAAVEDLVKALQS